VSKPNATTELDQLISGLELEHRAGGLLLKEDYRVMFESLQPAHIVTSVLQELKIQPGITTAVKDAAVGLAARFVAQKIQLLPGDNPMVQSLKKVAAMFLTGVAPITTQK
jgi:hypothetical protein